MGISDKVPPQNIDAEQSVLGAMLLDKDAVINVAGVLKPEFFYQQAHADIYDSILELFEEAMPIDIVTLADKLSAKKKLKRCGGQTYLTDLVSGVPTSAHAEEYAKIVKASALRRQLINSAAKITELSFQEDKEIQKVIGLVRENI